MLVHSRKVDLTLNAVEPLRGEELPEVLCCRWKAFTSPEFSKVLVTEDVGESFVKGDDNAVQVVCSCSDSPCDIKDMSNKDVGVSLMYRRDGKTGVVAVGVLSVPAISLHVDSRVYISLRALHNSGTALALQQTDRA